MTPLVIWVTARSTWSTDRHLVVTHDGVEGYLFDPLGDRRWVALESGRSA